MKKEISLDSLKSGQELGQNIFNEREQLLLREKTLITEAILSNLKSKGMETVFIEVDEKEVENVAPKEFEEKYRESIIQDYHFFKKSQELKFEIKRTIIRSKYNKKTSHELRLKIKEIVELILAFDADFSLYFQLRKEQRDKDYLYENHLLNTAVLCAILAKNLYLPLEEITDISLAGSLHDIGKAKIHESIIYKSDSLDEKEWEIIKNHPRTGAIITNKNDWIKPKVTLGVLYHHERLDGTGYPEGVLGRDIPLIARVVAVAGSFDTMTTDKPYKLGDNVFQSINHLRNQSHAQLDPKVTRLLFERILDNYINTEVELDNGEKGIIEYYKELKENYLIRTETNLYNIADPNVPNIVCLANKAGALF